MRAFNVLVVDDSKIARNFVTTGLEASRMVGTIHEATDGPEAVEMISQRDYDVVLCDVQMPTMSGMEVVAAVKAERQKQDRKMPFIIFMSATVTPELYVQAEALGAVEFLTKPFRDDEIKALLILYARMSTPSKVLVVDDSSTIRKVVQKIFKSSAFTLEYDEADSAKVALEKIAAQRYDAIFMDVNMPNMNGMQAYAMIKSISPSLKVMLMSSESRQDIKARAGALKLDGFLHKPFRANDVDLALCYMYGIKMPKLAAKAAASESLLEQE